MNEPSTLSRRAYLAALGGTATAGCIADSPDGHSRTSASTARPTKLERTSMPNATDSVHEAITTDTVDSTDAPTDSRDPELPGGESLDAFHHFGEDWSNTGGATIPIQLAYGELPGVGMASAGDNRVRISRRFDDALNFEAWDLSLATQLHATTKEVLQVGVTLVDADGEWRRLSGGILHTATQRWVRLDLGLQSDTGVDLTAITELHIDHWAGEGESEFAIADLRRHPKPDIGYVMLTFDDGPKEDYTVAYDVLSKYDMVGTAFPHTKTVSGPRGPTVAQYREMVADGWDVGGHTELHSRLPDFSLSEQRRILTENREFLAAHDLTPGVFRTPFGAYDHHTLDLMAELFDVSIVGNGAGTGTNLDISDPATVAFDPGDDYSLSQHCIDVAAANKQLLGLTIHMVRMESRESFEAVVRHTREYVQTGELEVITPSRLYEEYIRA